MFGENYLSSEKVCLGASFLQELKEHQNPNHHALARLRQADHNFYFLIVDGKFYPSCVATGKNVSLLDTEKALQDNWFGAKISHGCLPDFAIRAAKIWFSANPLPGVENYAAGDFVVMLKNYQNLKQPGMLWAQHGQDQFFVFFPGSGKAVDQVVDISSGELVADPILISTLLESLNSKFSAAYFPFSAESEAWQEYLLHRYFCEICEVVLHRYGLLTGKIMTQSLERTIYHFTKSNDWPIEFRKGHIIDHLALSDTKQYHKTYQYILAHMFHHISLSIGKKLAMYLLGDYLNNELPENRAKVSSLLSSIDGFSSP